MKTLILGGGISGLSAAWYLRQREPHAEITLLDKEPRLGGAIQTYRHGGLLFERGPRTFLCSASHLLQLIREVGLDGDLLYSHPDASKRYLWHKAQLRSLGSFWPMLLSGLVRQLFAGREERGDESIYEFGKRRFGIKITETLLDSMALGIFAGDIHKLSMRACFPSRKKISFRKSRLFTLQRGMESLVEALQKKLSIRIACNCPAEKIETDGVWAGGKKWEADRIFSALPALELSRASGVPFALTSNSLWVVPLAFAKSSLKKRGFGYLVPTCEREDLLGMVFDSELFPRKSQDTLCLSAMVRAQGDAAWAKEVALDAARRHLQIEKKPFVLAPFFAREAIPQFEVGHLQRLALFRAALKERFPNLSLLGNYLGGASVDACIRLAKHVVGHG